MSKYTETLSRVSNDRKRPMELALSDWMDFLIDLWDLEHVRNGYEAWAQHVLQLQTENPEYLDLNQDWAADVTRAMEKGTWLDLFGNLYEALYLSRGKASSQGQFFTPQSVSDLMAQIATGKKENGLVADCAAGSGRLLLSHYMQVTHVDHGKRFGLFYEATDNDPVACKMCALNMMMHGMHGKVICRNSLLMDTPSVIYHINEIRYPFPTMFYSIRREYPKE